MKISPRTLLAAALLTALPMGSALACTISAWTGTPSSPAPTAGGPATGVARYSGVCALSTASGQYVVDNTPGAEGTYRARFYVLPSAVTGGAATIFKATVDNNGAGTNVVTVGYNGTAFNFTQNGTAVGTPINAAAGKWYSVEVYYKAGAAFQATVAGGGNGATLGTVNVTSGIGAGTVGSAVLGVSSGTASAPVRFDAFESTRSETTAIGRLCRGDANGDGNINTFDVNAVINERVNGNLAQGQVDCNEDGSVNAFDQNCVITLRLASATCS